MSEARRSVRLATKLAVIAVAMFGFGYLLSPLYLRLCRLTGVNQLQSADKAAGAVAMVADRTVIMQFDGNLRDRLPWMFHPNQPEIRLHPGQIVHASFEVRNNADRAVTGQAIASFAPAGAAAYVRKLECFCFSMQTLAPHEVREMPVIFLVDPSLPGDVALITLSYTFFEVPGRQTAARHAESPLVSRHG